MWRNKLNERNRQMANIIFDEAEKQKIRSAAHYQASSETMRGVKKDLSYLISDNEPDLREGVVVEVDGEKILIGIHYAKQLTFTVMN